MPWDEIHGLWLVVAIIGYAALDLLFSWLFNRFVIGKPNTPPTTSEAKKVDEPKP